MTTGPGGQPVRVRGKEHGLFRQGSQFWFRLKGVPSDTCPRGPRPAGRRAILPIFLLRSLFLPLLCLRDPLECPRQLDKEWKPQLDFWKKSERLASGNTC